MLNPACPCCEDKDTLVGSWWCNSREHFRGCIQVYVTEHGLKIKGRLGLSQLVDVEV